LKMRFLPIWLATSAFLALFPACNFGSFSFGAKPATTSTSGSPTQQSSSAPVAMKFQVKVHNPSSNTEEVSAVVPFDLGLCSPAMTVEAVTSTGSRAAVRADTIVYLSGVNAFKLFADKNCVSALPSDGATATVEIEKGTGSAIIYMKTNSLGDVRSYNLVAAASGYQSATRSLRVDQTRQSLSFGSSASTLLSGLSSAGGAVCETFYVNGVDGINNPYFGSGSVAAQVQTTSGALYPASAGNCSGPGSSSLSMTLTSSPESRKFFFQSGRLGLSSTIGQTAALSVISSFPTASLNVNVIAKPVQFELLMQDLADTQYKAFPAQPTNVISLCSAFKLRLLDAGGNPVISPVSQTYSLSTAKVGGVANLGSLYTNATCSSAGGTTASLTINPAADSAVFSFRANDSAVDTNLVHDQFTLTAAPSVSVTAPMTLFGSRNSPAISLKAELRAVAMNNDYATPRYLLCNGPYTLELQDGRPNKPYLKGGTIRLTTASGTRFFTNSTCTSEITNGNVTVAAGTSGASYYFQDLTSVSDSSIAQALAINVALVSPSQTAPASALTGLSIGMTNPLLMDTGNFFSGGSTPGYKIIPYAISGFPRIRATAAQGAKFLVAGKTNNGIFLGRFNNSGTSISTLDTSFGFNSNGLRACDLNIPMTNSSNYHTLTSAEVEAINAETSVIYVAGTANITHTVITTEAGPNDANGNPTTVQVTNRDYWTGYFIARLDANGFSCPGNAGSSTLYVGRFDPGNVGNGARALAYDAANGALVVAGDSGSFDGLSRRVALAVHPIANLNNPSVQIVGADVGAPASARFVSVSGNRYNVIGGTSSALTLAEFNRSSGSFTSETTAFAGQAEFVAAVKAANGKTYVLARNPSTKVASVIGYDGVIYENSFFDNSVILDGASGGIAVYPTSSTSPDSGKIVISGGVETSGGSRGFVTARYSSSGVADSSKYLRTFDPYSGAPDDAVGIHIQSDGRLFVAGNANNATAVGAVTYLR